MEFVTIAKPLMLARMACALYAYFEHRRQCCIVSHIWYARLFCLVRDRRLDLGGEFV